MSRFTGSVGLLQMANVRFSPLSEVEASSAEVGSWWQSGPDLLNLSSSQFDAERTLPRRRLREDFDTIVW